MRKHRQLGRKSIAALLASVLLMLSLPVCVYATSSTKQQLDEAQKERDQTAGQIKDKEEDISGLQKEQNSLKGTLSTLTDELTQVSDNLEQLESEITQKEEEITQTRQELEEARDTADHQYEVMKLRLQFIYENGSFAYFDMLLNTEHFTSMLNYADYIEDISAYDRNMLDRYRETIRLVAEKEAALEDEMAQLSDLKVATEAEKSRVSGLVSKTSGSIAKFADQISDAEAEVQAYEEKLKEQDANIAALKKKYEEELRLSQLAAASAWRDISEVAFADGDRYLLANLIYCEAGGEPYAGKLAVGSVVINRVLSSVYPDTVVGVIYQRKQFSPVGSGRLALALAENRATAACYQAADEAMSGVTNVGNCVYFRTPIEGLTGISIGGHIFY
ncbi:MAG: cell wall hydrolase [Lachnospiraceae bacterium]|nr:cell wall hydrolase [Lachnospiraceae bacterium]